MSYVTQTEIEKAFGADELIALADRDGDGVADADVVTAAIKSATGIIDSYLRSRFTLPLAAVPDLVRDCALAIVRYRLSEDHATDRVNDDYKQALKWLTDVREGRMDIGLTDVGAAVPSSSGGAEFGGGRSGISDDALDAYAGSGE